MCTELMCRCLFGKQVQSGINRQGNHPSGALVPVTAVTFEAPRVGAPACLTTWQLLHLQIVQTNADLLKPLYSCDLSATKDAPAILHSVSSAMRGRDCSSRYHGFSIEETLLACCMELAACNA